MYIAGSSLLVAGGRQICDGIVCARIGNVSDLLDRLTVIRFAPTNDVPVQPSSNTGVSGVTSDFPTPPNRFAPRRSVRNIVYIQLTDFRTRTSSDHNRPGPRFNQTITVFIIYVRSIGGQTAYRHVKTYGRRPAHTTRIPRKCKMYTVNTE